MTSLILLPTDIREIDGYVWHGSVDTYLKAVVLVGATPIMLPSLGDALDLPALLARVDGVLLTGARSNVHPSRYGQTPSERHEPYDADRDATTMRLIPLALEAGVPLLAICRGFQELNVALGGTLVTEAQERAGSLDHRAPVGVPNDERFKLVHEVDFEADSALAKLVGARCIRVNSVHRQVIGELSPRLIVEGRAPDGTVEAVRVRGATGFAFGVQWHPEYWAATDPASGAIFRAFADAARRRAGRSQASTAPAKSTAPSSVIRKAAASSSPSIT
jgi:putative glutamine amidotransferase